MSDFGETLTPVGRKQHRCEWCYWPIPKGEKHKQYKGVFDGAWQNWRMHDECYTDSANEIDDGFTPGCADPPERIRIWWTANKSAKEASNAGE